MCRSVPSELRQDQRRCVGRALDLDVDRAAVVSLNRGHRFLSWVVIPVWPKPSTIRREWVQRGADGQARLRLVLRRGGGVVSVSARPARTLRAARRARPGARWAGALPPVVARPVRARWRGSHGLRVANDDAGSGVGAGSGSASLRRLAPASRLQRAARLSQEQVARSPEASVQDRRVWPSVSPSRPAASVQSRRGNRGGATAGGSTAGGLALAASDEPVAAVAMMAEVAAVIADRWSVFVAGIFGSIRWATERRTPRPCDDATSRSMKVCAEP